MGLGSAAEVSLKEARTEAIRWWAVARNNVDPIKERERLRREAARHLHLLKEIAEDAFESRKAKLKGDVTAGRWFTPLKLHVIPQLGKMPIAEVDQIDIRDALSPIWPTKAETAKKALNRLHICFKHAAALGLDVDIHAPAKARALLGQQRHKATNIPAMPWRDVPSFYATLDDGTVTHLAFRLLILTGVRSSPLRFLRPDEQIQDDVWTKQQHFSVPKLSPHDQHSMCHLSLLIGPNSEYSILTWALAPHSHDLISSSTVTDKSPE